MSDLQTLLDRNAGGPPGSLSRSQKAAAVLLSVGPQSASKVLEHLSQSEVEQITLEIATLGDVQSDRLEVILREFYDEAIAHQHLVSGGERNARELLRTLRGADGDDIVDRLLATVQTSPFQFLRLHEPTEVTQHLRDEHPQTIALVVAHLPTKFGAQVLAGLDPEVQTDVAYRLATLERTSPEVLERVEAALRDRLGAIVRGPDTDERGGVRELASLLNHSDRATERAILGNLESDDPELAEEVRALMFVFEDLTTLDARAIQEVLRQVDTKVLATALKGVSGDVRSVVERNLSERACQSLREEIEFMGPTRLRDVEDAQTEVVRQVRLLEEQGVIVITRGDGEFVE